MIKLDTVATAIRTAPFTSYRRDKSLPPPQFEVFYEGPRGGAHVVARYNDAESAAEDLRWHLRARAAMIALGVPVDDADISIYFSPRSGV